MFSKTAEFYDLVYSFKNYENEAKKIRGAILSELPTAKSLLDVACGTGEHARHLDRDFDVDGIDLQPEFIQVAQRKVASGTFAVGDMRSFDLQKRYDVVQCLFSSIGYLTHPDEVISALRCFRNHLKPGGIILVEPWFTPETYHPGRPHMAPPVDQSDIKIVRMNVSEKEGRLSLLRFHYLIASKEGVEHVEEDHQLALYTIEEMRSFFDSAHLQVKYDPEGIFGRGLYVAREKA